MKKQFKLSPARAGKLSGRGTDNISSMFFSTSIMMIFTEVTGIAAILIDGVITSRFLGVDVFSGISLLKPFSGMVLVIDGFLSTGCIIACSKLVGVGQRAEANSVFSLAVKLSLLFSAFMIAACVLFPETILRLCGVSLTKYPQLLPHMYGYLHGYMIGIPFLGIIQVMVPVLVMDSGKRIFTISTAVLCVSDIIGDLLNVFVFHGGAFGMGAVTAASYVLQLAVLLLHFTKSNSYFRVVFRSLTLRRLLDIFKNGTPTLTRKLSGTLRDVLVNYINIMAALSAAAIAARGIQNDLFHIAYCIPTGLGRTLITMAGLYYGANDQRGLERLYSYSFGLGFKLSGLAAVFFFAAAPLLARIYTSDPEVTELAVFSIRWISAALIFDTCIVLTQHYLQGIGKVKEANLLSTAERFIVPVICALTLGLLFGSKGILASVAVGKAVLLLILFLRCCVLCKGLPRKWHDVMFLPEDFGGRQSDNMYAQLRNTEDVVRESRRTQEFCLEHGTGKRTAALMSLFVEEMAANVMEHAERKNLDAPCVDFRLFMNDETICVSLMDLSDRFDPTAFYEFHHDDDPEKHIGIRMVTKMAREVRYFSTFNSNNLLIYMDREQ